MVGRFPGSRCFDMFGIQWGNIKGNTGAYDDQTIELTMGASDWGDKHPEPSMPGSLDMCGIYLVEIKKKTDYTLYRLCFDICMYIYIYII